MQIFAESPDQEYQILREKGYVGTLNDMQYKYLEDQGYTSGALGDRMLAYFQAEFGYFSWQQYAATEFDLTTPTKSWLLELGVWDDDEYWRDQGDWTTTIVENTISANITAFTYEQINGSSTFNLYLTLSTISYLNEGNTITFTGIENAGEMYDLFGEGNVLDFRTINNQSFTVTDLTGPVATISGDLGFTATSNLVLEDSDPSDLGTSPQVTYTGGFVFV